MTLYEKPSFTLPATGKAPKDCRHGWLDAKGKCVLCGVPNPEKPVRKQMAPTWATEAIKRNA